MDFDLRQRRANLEMTQAELAEALGVAPNTIARWERGEREPEGQKILDLALHYLELKHELERQSKQRRPAALALLKRVASQKTKIERKLSLINSRQRKAA
jgi:transcriptional regulator with XRE-family HTH domain